MVYGTTAECRRQVPADAYDFIGVRITAIYPYCLFVVFAFIILKNFVLHKMNNYR